MRAFLKGLALAASTVFAQETVPAEVTEPVEAGQAYNYKSNGSDWGEENALCANGKEQSPIDLNEGAEENDKMEINGYGYMNYPDGKFITHKGDTLQMDFTDGEFQLTFPDGSMSLFEPLDMHFRSPSEHTVEGKHHDLELQILHQYKGTNGQFGAVIAIFFDVEDGGSEANPFIESLLFPNATFYIPDGPHIDPDSSLWQNETLGTHLNVTDVQLASLLASIDMTNYWSYPGSLTSPPCTEGVKWTILPKVQSISEEQLAGFTNWFSGNTTFADGNGNNRAVQELNERTVYYAVIPPDDGAIATAIGSAVLAAVAFLAF